MPWGLPPLPRWRLRRAEPEQGRASTVTAESELPATPPRAPDASDRNLGAVPADVGVPWTPGSTVDRLGGFERWQEEGAQDRAVRERRFAPDQLRSLELDAYVALWRSHNHGYLSHVTRQGFRDHVGMIYHTGELEEFSGGFEALLRDGGIIRPPLHLRSGPRDLSDDQVRAFLDSEGVLDLSSAEEASRMLMGLLDHSLAAAPKFADKTAVHFGAERVLDELYGGERGNEIFIAYPADFIASQHALAFNGAQRDLRRPQSEDKWNDVMVWQEGGFAEQGLDVDCGIVFLPKDTPVDPDTGSIYDSELTPSSDGPPIRTLIADDRPMTEFLSWWKEHGDAIAQRYADAKERSSDRHSGILEAEEGIRDQLVSFGFHPVEASAILGKVLDAAESETRSFSDTALEDIALRGRLRFRRASNPIRAQEYWENFFDTHPDLRPRRVVYYDGDPSEAVDAFRREHRIKPRTDAEPLLGFEDHLVDDPRSDPRSNPGRDDLVAVAQRVIEEHYRETRL